MESAKPLYQVSVKYCCLTLYKAYPIVPLHPLIYHLFFLKESNLRGQEAPQAGEVICLIDRVPQPYQNPLKLENVTVRSYLL